MSQIFDGGGEVKSFWDIVRNFPVFLIMTPPLNSHNRNNKNNYNSKNNKKQQQQQKIIGLCPNRN